MKKIFTKSKVALTSLLLAGQLVLPASSAFAIDIPTPPTAPEAPVAPTAPTIPVTAPVAPTAPPAPVAAPAPTYTSSSGNGSNSQNGSTNSGNGSGSHNQSSNSQNNNTEVVNVNDANVVNNQAVDVTTGSNDANKNGGDASVTSGDAGISGGLMTDINNNTITIGDLCGQGCSAGFVDANLKNGNGTLNNADGSLTNLVILNNSNNLNLTNNSRLGASTGYNNTNKNMGSGSIVSGDADVVFTTINFGNNNGINATTADYNIVDDQSTDLWIMFPTGVASGSGLGQIGAINGGNGADSTNSANTSSNSSMTIDNNNNLILNNDINLYANTGNNTSDKNMGSGNITTGDANIASNVINFLNNNIVAGAEWLLTTVNIFGNMTGNIILPREADLSGCGCAADITAGNIGNGSGSTNNANTNVNNATTINEVNNAVVGNNLNIDANTGGNTTDKNMGDSSITTGDTSVSSNLVTVANTNTVGQGDTWWLVIVNNHGTYTGQIVGADDNTIAGSGLEFGVSPNGTVYALNSGNGADSTNNANTSSNNSTTINNTNNAVINNNINIDANTGDNSASKNMGGADIKTGDVNVVSNIVNFINNNFVGKKFVVTLVNIFGSFSGKIVPPDQALPQAAGMGGPTSGVALASSTTVSGTGTKTAKVAVVGGSSAGGSVSGSISKALLDSGKILEDAAATHINGSVTKGISSGTQKTSFQFNFVMLGLALLVLAGYAFVSRRKTS